MSNPSAAEELDPASARMVARVRLMMAIAGATTFVAIAAVLGVIGYRLFQAEGSAPGVSAMGAGGAPADITALLPKGARIIATAATADRIAVTIEVAGATEIRTFDAKTLKPVGRLRFATEP
jgi:hypothetical protein